MIFMRSPPPTHTHPLEMFYNVGTLNDDTKVEWDHPLHHRSLSRTSEGGFWRCYRQRAWLGPLGRLMCTTSFLHRQRVRKRYRTIQRNVAEVSVTSLNASELAVVSATRGTHAVSAQHAREWHPPHQ